MIDIEVSIVKTKPYYDRKQVRIQLPSVPRVGEHLTMITGPGHYIVSGRVSFVGYMVKDGKPDDVPVSITIEVDR